MSPTKATRFDALFLLVQSAVNDARMLNIARTLVRNGKSVALIAYGGPLDAERLAGEGIRLFAVEGSTRGRLALRLLRFMRQARLYLRRIRPASCWAEDVFSLPLACQTARRHKAKLLYDSREIYSALGTLGTASLRQRIISGVERHYFRHVDSCFVSGPMDAEYLADQFRCPLPKVVMNVPPYKPQAPGRVLRERFRLNNSTRIVLYQGGIFPGKGLDIMLHALGHLHNAVFCVAGDGEYLPEVRRRARDLGLEDRLLLCGRIPYDELPLWTASADVGLALIEPLSLSYRLALPNKLFEYIMAGIPSVVSDLPAMRPVLERHAVGKLVSAACSARELADVIEELCNPQLREEWRSACSAAAREYCWENQESTILELLEH